MGPLTKVKNYQDNKHFFGSSQTSSPHAARKKFFGFLFEKECFRSYRKLKKWVKKLFALSKHSIPRAAWMPVYLKGVSNMCSQGTILMPE